MTRKLTWTLVVATAAALAVPAPALAAPTTVTATCEDGDYTGRVVLHHRTGFAQLGVTGGRGGSGPYIGDSGAMRVRISYRQDSTEHVVFDQTRRGLAAGHDHDVEVPAGTRIPVNATGHVRATFTGGGRTCTATSRIR